MGPPGRFASLADVGFALALVAGSAPARAQTPPERPRAAPAAGVIALPDGDASEELALRVEREIHRALGADARVRAVNLTRKLGVDLTGRAAQGEEILQNARAAYDNLDVDGAARQVAASIKLLVEVPGEIDVNRLGYAWCLLASANLLNGDERRAMENFRNAATMAPGYKPDPKVFAPDQIERHARAAAEVKAGPKGTLVVNADARPAEVVIGGALVGPAPVTLPNLPVGRHLVVVRRRGHATHAAFVRVGPAAEGVATVDARLPQLASAQRFLAAADRAERDAEDGSVGDGALGIALDAGVQYLVLVRVERDGDSVRARLSVVDAARRAVVFAATRTAEAAALPKAAAAWTGEILTGALETPGAVAQSGPVADRAAPWMWIAVGAGAALVIGLVATAVGPRGRPGPFITGIP